MCKLRFWFPRALDAKYYETSRDYTGHRRGLSVLQRWHKSALRSWGFSGSVLDVGCGDGVFAAELKSQGCEVHGIDINQFACEAAINVRGLDDVYHANLDDYTAEILKGKGSARYDIITFFEVLEHQAAPKKFIQNIRKLISADGIIVGSVPNRNRLLIWREESDYPPHHFLWWSKDSLGFFLSSNGYEQIEIHSKDSFYDLVCYTEYIILHKLGYRVRAVLKSLLTREQEDEVKSIPIDSIKGSSGVLLKFMRICSVAFFTLPALFLWPWLRPNLYFKAASKKAD